MRQVLVVSLLALVVLAAGCNIPGSVRFAKDASGSWQPVEVIVPYNDTNPDSLQRIANRLNGR